MWDAEHIEVYEKCKKNNLHASLGRRILVNIENIFSTLKKLFKA